jgi:hypothetical protein
MPRLVKIEIFELIWYESSVAPSTKPNYQIEFQIEQPEDSEELEANLTSIEHLGIQSFLRENLACVLLPTWKNGNHKDIFDALKTENYN